MIQAGLVSHNGEKVKLKRADGKEFEVIPSIFSDDDEAYIKKWMANNPAIKNYKLWVGTAKKKIEGKSAQNAELGFNRTLEVTSTPVQIELVHYDYAGRYKDELKGCLVRIVDQDDKVVLDWVSPEVSMKGKDWLNTNPAPTGGTTSPAVIR